MSTTGDLNRSEATEQTSMTFNEWFRKDAHIDKLVAVALPPLNELDKMTFDAIFDGYGSTIVQAAKALGIDLTDAEVEEIVERLVGVKEWPAFRHEHYDLLC